MTTPSNVTSAPPAHDVTAALETIPPMILWSTRFPHGWDGTEDGADVAALHPAIDALEVLVEPHDTDAHAVGYLVPKHVEQGGGYEDVAPRLNTRSLGSLIRAGVEPVVAWVFVDVDNAGHAKWTHEEATRSVRGIFERSPNTLLASAAWYTTGGGFRLLWRLADPVRATEYRSWAGGEGKTGAGGFLEALSKQTGIPLVTAADRDAAKRDGREAPGGIDTTCAQWSRCYRLPRVVRDGVLQAPGMDLSRLLKPGGALLWSPRRALQRDPVALPTAGDIEVGGAPPFPSASDVTAAQWAALAGAKGGVGADCYLSAWLGKPLATKGNRNTAMISAIGEVCAILGADAHAAAPNAAEQGEDAIAGLVWRVLARAIAADDTDGAPTLVQLWDRARHFSSKTRDGLALAAVMETQPAIVFTGTGRYYVWNERTGGYEEPVSGVGLVQSLETYAPTLGLVTRSPVGKPRSEVELVTDYGQPARRVSVRLGAELTVYDRASGTLTEAAARRLDVPAIRHRDVEAWLGLLFGDGVDGSGSVIAARALDWLATVRVLERPTCAVYLQGPPSVGKGMLVAGLAGLFGAAGACAYSEAIGAFNAALTQCPIVHVDEAIEAGSDSGGRPPRGWSASFRTLISETTRPLRRKYQETATLIGAPRLVITANNADALRLRERLTAEDVAAIAARILHARACAGAADYLRDLGGRDYTEDWTARATPGGGTKPGKIAEHISYLEATRRVERGSRLLVEGVMGDYHRDLSVSHGLTAEILGAIATAADRGNPPPGIWFGLGDASELGDVVHVNAPALRKSWPAITGNPAPNDNALASALASLAVGGSGVRRIAGKATRTWSIPVASVLRVAEILQIGDPDLLPGRLRGATPGKV